MMENFQISMELYVKNLFILLLLLIVIVNIVLLFYNIFLKNLENKKSNIKHFKKRSKKCYNLRTKPKYEKLEEKKLKFDKIYMLKKVKNKVIELFFILKGKFTNLTGNSSTFRDEMKNLDKLKELFERFIKNLKKLRNSNSRAVKINKLSPKESVIIKTFHENQEEKKNSIIEDKTKVEKKIIFKDGKEKIIETEIMKQNVVERNKIIKIDSKNNLTNLKKAERAFKEFNSNEQKIAEKKLNKMDMLARKLDTNIKKQYKKDTKIKQNQTFKKLDEDLKKIIKIRNKKNEKNNKKTKISNNLNKKEDKIKNDILAISAAKKDIEMKQFENKEIKDKIADI